MKKVLGRFDLFLVALLMFGIAITFAAASWSQQQQCKVVDFEEFEPNTIVVESKGVTFTPGEFRTYPSDCVGAACPCADQDLSFPGQGNSLIKQEGEPEARVSALDAADGDTPGFKFNGSQCTPDDDANGALFETTIPGNIVAVSGKLLDIEEGAQVTGYFQGIEQWTQSHQTGNNQMTSFNAPGPIDFIEIICEGSCAIDDIEFCEPSEPILGASCLEDGDCVEDVTESACEELGCIDWQEGASCEDLTCGDPETGACCAGYGDCINETTEEQCAGTGEGWIWYGDTDCEDVICETPVPTMNQWFLIVLGVVLAIAGVFGVRRFVHRFERMGPFR